MCQTRSFYPLVGRIMVDVSIPPPIPICIPMAKSSRDGSLRFTCPICAAAVSSERELARHWGTCFEDHSPTKAEPRAPPQLEHQQTGRCYQARLGSHPLPPSAISLLVDTLLPLPSRIALAKTSKEGRRLVDSCESWAEFIGLQWRALWEQSVGYLPDGTCGCTFRDPRTLPLDAKEIAVRLWRACNIATAEITTKGFTGRLTHMFLDGSFEEPGFRPRRSSAVRQPALLHTTVHQLKKAYQHREGPPLGQFMFVKPGSVPLSHIRAPLAAYVWDLLDMPGRQARIRLDVTFRTGRLCAEDLDP